MNRPTSMPPLRPRLRAYLPIVLAIPIFLLMAMSTAVTAHADVICVPNLAVDGTCTTSQATIQAAINAAVTAVDTVLVGAGTYNENLTLAKNIPLRGAQRGVDACGRVASESIVTAASGDLLTSVQVPPALRSTVSTSPALRAESRPRAARSTGSRSSTTGSPASPAPPCS